MSVFNPYDLCGKQYIAGDQDCYSVVRDYYSGAFGITLPNYARPLAFDRGGINLIGMLKADPDYLIVPAARLELRKGDVLTFMVASDFENHFGVYLGNNMFIHHLYNKNSEESNLDNRWYTRLVSVLRHVDVPFIPEKDIWDFLPAELRQKV
jgi:cell wall-associated NlpC family hydrolase